MNSKQAGFSLVELIIVVAIMAILIGVLAPQYIKYVEKSRVSADEDNAGSLYESAYSMVADDDYFEGLNDGDTITFSDASGISASSTTIQNALAEFYSADLSTIRPKSKTYKSKTYKIEFKKVDDDEFDVLGSWN